MTEEVKLRAEIGKLKFLSANFYSGLVKNCKKVIKQSVNMAF